MNRRYGRLPFRLRFTSSSESQAIQIKGAIRIKGVLNKSCRRYEQGYFDAVSSKLNWMLLRRMRGNGKRLAKMNSREREARVAEIVGELLDKFEARLLPRNPRKLLESLNARNRENDGKFLETLGRTLQSAPNPILNKTEHAIIFARVRFPTFRSLSDEEQIKIISFLLNKKWISLDGYRKTRERIGVFK